MRLEAINLGRRETIRLGSRTLDTGIDKRPVARATVGLLAVEGDTVADTKHHGGPDTGAPTTTGGRRSSDAPSPQGHLART